SPPLARMISPVTAVLAAEQRNTIVGATSSGGRMRRIGECAARCSRTSAGKRSTFPSVSVNPGITTFTRIPSGPYSLASVRVRPCSAALAGAYHPRARDAIDRNPTRDVDDPAPAPRAHGRRDELDRPHRALQVRA